MKFIKSHSNLKILAFFLIINCVFFYKIFLGFVPLPLDHLVGGLFPWHDYKWGYSVGVPIENPGLSDVFGQIYPWRALAADIYRSGQIPLWNIYQFLGTPLMANLQSAVFYPLNFLLLIFGNLYGFTLVIFLQTLLSMFFMYLYLREIELDEQASFLGGIVFAFSGFMITYMEISTIGQVFLWLPLLLFGVEKFIRQRRVHSLVLLSIGVFCLLTAGNFQIALYAFCLLGIYIIGKVWTNFRNNKVRFRDIILIFNFLGLGVGLAAIQILPTLEFLQLSIRGSDHNIYEYGLGLLPLSHLITFLAPDFFGNPSTYNYWGFLTYVETAFYFGLVPLILASLVFLIKDHNFKFYKYFYLSLFGTSLLLAFNTIFGKAIYDFNIPIFSTSYASRAVLLLDFSAAVLAAMGFHFLKNNLVTSFRIGRIYLGVLVGVLLGILVSLYVLNNDLEVNQQLVVNLKIALKNMVISFGVVILFLLALRIKNIKYIKLIILLLSVFELMRFGLKFTPFSQGRFDFPVTPTLTYLQQNSGNYRVERERTEVMPPNTWVPYKLMSPSGYDPLYSRDYANFYSVYNGGLPDEHTTRYAELNNYHSPVMDLMGVKYILAVKRDKFGVIKEDTSGAAMVFDQPRFKSVFTTGTSVVIENSNVLPRVMLFDLVVEVADQNEALKRLHEGFDFRKGVLIEGSLSEKNLQKDPTDFVEIIKYEANEVSIKTKTKGETILMLTDAYYPGWKAYIGNKEVPIVRADGAFRAILLPGGEENAYFKYEPESFKNGVKISLLSLGLIVVMVIFFPKQFLKR